jgi:hypothetical protein
MGLREKLPLLVLLPVPNRIVIPTGGVMGLREKLPLLILLPIPNRSVIPTEA